jgi:hypothetical protein
MIEFVNEIIGHSKNACNRINTFSLEVLKTRGGRIGSGMGLLLEALWGYHMNIELKDHPIEIAWFPDHQYNDFVCLKKGETWDINNRKGEVCRLEVKSMNSGAEESKAHFDVLKSDIQSNDLLLVLTWEWRLIDTYNFSPFITDYFIGYAHEVIDLRDALHITRGGLFTSNNNCPENCECLEGECRYEGEPLNAALRRERLSGPPSTQPSDKVSYAANFGGLLRMIKTSGEESRLKLREIRKNSSIAHDYISFIHRNYPSEELNQYTKEEWFKIAKSYNDKIENSLSKNELFDLVKKENDYQERLKNFL